MTIDDKKRESGEVYHGHDVCIEKAIELLEQNGLPGGLLPLEDVEECGIVRETGFVWMISKKNIDHYFKLAKRKVFYDREITATIGKNALMDVKGVKARELLINVEVNEIEVAPVDGKIHFRGLMGITRTFPVEAFARGQ